jgi:predicted DNA-binding ribbon-helix-helix protein
MTSDGATPSAGDTARPVKRSFTIAGHKTSVSLESAFWIALREAAAREGVTLAGLVQRIDSTRGSAGLSSALRVWLLADAQRRSQLPLLAGP